jgi:hypothetical protein
MMAEPKIDARRLDRVVADVQGEEQRAHAGEPPLPPDDVPPPSDQDVPPLRRSRLDPNDPRPEIVLSTEQPAVVDAAERALATMGGVYVRGRQLVHVVRDRGGPGWLKRPLGTPVIVPIERDHLLDLLGRAAAWFVIKDDVRRRVSPPAWVAARLLARGQWDLPELESIADAPVFRADGSIFDLARYDERTRVIFDPCGAAFPPVPAEPTREDASRALADLLEPFAEFPFVADSDRAAAVALILSVIGRAAINGCVPMFSSQAPTPGSGKGLLVDVAAVIATGRRAPLMAPTDDDDETRKRLLAIAMESPPMVVIDNVEGALGSASLSMALTAGVVSERQLGATKMVTASLRPVWVVTGNNVQLKGDLGRRVVPIDLDPKVEHPEDRTFKRSDLVDYVQENRPRLVIAALTILRTFVVAGWPAHNLPPKGSFEAWDRLVRSAIIWTGTADPLGGVQRIREQADEDLDRLRALLAAWVGLLRSDPVTIADAIRRAGDSGDLHDALAAYGRSGQPEARALGYALRKAQGRVVAGLAFRRDAPDRNGIARWAVVRCG